MILPARPRRIRLAVLRSSAVVAASVLVVSLGALYTAGLSDRAQDDAFPPSTTRLAYYDSPEYELSLLQVAESRKGSGRGVFRI